MELQFHFVTFCRYRSLRFFSLAILFLLIILFHDLGFAKEKISADLSGQTINKVKINIIGVKHNIQKWESLAENLIPIKQQDIYSLEKIEQAIADLVDSKLFKSIHVTDPEQTPYGVQIAFTLTPFDRIKEIVIKNAFPLFQHEVINAMTIFTGGVFSQKRLNEQAGHIKNLFKNHGYIDPVIKVKAQQDSSDGNYMVVVEIDKKAFFEIKRVTIAGNHHFSSSRLKLRTKIWKASIFFGSGRRFIKKNMDDDIKNLVEFYRKKGFVDVRITSEVIKDKNSVDIILHINEGPEYKISFQGNENFWDYTLKKEIAFAKHGNKKSSGIRKSIRKLKKKYIEDGYLDVSIEHQIIDNVPQNPSRRDVIFKIKEGCQYKMVKLDIVGNKTISRKKILKNILTQPSGFGIGGVYVPGVLKEDIKAVKALYLSHGFTKIIIDKEIAIKEGDKTEEKFVAVDLIIHEGMQTLVDSIDFKDLTMMSYDKALSYISLQPGGIFNESEVENDKKSLIENISKAGHPHVKVTVVKKINQDRSRINLCYKINEGQKVEVGEIVYVGNLKTEEYILENEMEITKGEPFSLSKLIESRKNMLDMNALNSTGFRTIGLENRADEVNIVVEVEEKKPYFFEIAAGYDTERHLFFNSTIGDQNFMGRNLELQSTGEISQIGYKVDISLKEPKLFTSDISSSTQLFTEMREEFNKEFGTETYGFSQEFGKFFFNKTLITKLGFAYNYRDQYLINGSLQANEQADQYGIRHVFEISQGLIYNTTDSYVMPKQGFFSSFNMDISKGIGDELDDFIKMQLDARYYYTLFKTLTFAVRGKYGYVQPYGDNSTIPEDQLFFLGGTSSVRGFDENLLRFDENGKAVGGREILLGSIEARYDVGMNVELALFYDIGSVARIQGSNDSESFRDSVGIGLRYMTPIGPIGFLYGWKLDPEPGESTGNFHFSMGYTF
ncbi:MAG: outer membrane protein assembly factor BamA [Thermodesulfobacteriota bacterium]